MIRLIAIAGFALVVGAVANCVGIGRRVFGHDDAMRSGGEVKGLIGRGLRQGLPSVDLSHGDLP